jgi:hypothetical protein
MAFTAEQSGGSPHHFLAQLVGSWAGTTKTWIDPASEPSEARTQGSIQLILEGRFALYLYQSSVDGEPQHGMFTFGYDTTLDQYEASWVDSFHNNTAIMYCVGQGSATGFTVVGNYPDPMGGPDWSWRTELELIDSDRLDITAYNVSPEGGESLAVKTVLSRIKR